MSWIGILIGFYGYLFPGNINLMVVNLFQLKQYRFLTFILFLILLFESFYGVTTLLFLKIIYHNQFLYKTIEIFSLLLLFLLGIWMIIDGKKDIQTVQTNTNRRGIFSIIVHPQQIPFWMAITTLLSHVIYENITLFILYNAIGVLLLMVTYMLLGKLLFTYFNVNIILINKIIGFVYIGLSVYSIIHLLQLSKS